MSTLRGARSTMHWLAAIGRVKARNIQEVTWAVDRVHHRLPGRHSCLIAALVGDAVACASGIPVTFRLGAIRSESGHRFHAWIDHHGDAVIGWTDDRYVPFGNI